MPTVLIHEQVAYNIAKKYKYLDNANFYLGSLAPDSVNLNGFASKEKRWHSHLRHNDLDKWLDNVKSFYQENQNKYTKDFLLGYILHIITDIIHDKYFYPELRKQMSKNNIPESAQHLLIRENMKDYDLLISKEKFIEHIKILLDSTRGYDILNISKENMLLWKNSCFQNITLSVIPSKYITQKHIERLTDKVLDEFKKYII